MIFPFEYLAHKVYIQVNMVGKPRFYGKKINTFAAFLRQKCNLNKIHQDALSLS